MMPKLGAHVSTAGGHQVAFDNGERIGAEAVQIFGASPRQWNAPLPPPEAVAAFKKRHKASSVGPVYLHASYLINLASPKKDLWGKSVKSLTEHFRIANAFEADGLIFHTGSAGESPRPEAIGRVAEGMRRVLAAVSGPSFLMLENSAGGGNKIGNIPEDLADILDQLDSERAGVCFDTAHAFEAGQIEEYSTALIKKVFDRWDKLIGLKRIKALHANDSMTACNSNHDRHENIGKGFIGLAGFKNLAKEKRLNHTAWLLEVPGYEGLGPDKKNMDALKSCFK